MIKKEAAYEKLKFYQDICEIRRQTYIITERFKRSHLRLVSQMRDAARSAKQNIREGYKKGSVGEFRHSINISLGSLEELSGDIEDCLEDGIISKGEYDRLLLLFQSSHYLAVRYIYALNKMERAVADGSQKATLRNVS